MKIRGRSIVVCLGVLCLSAAHGQQYTIQTLAGNGSAAFTGDNGAAGSAQLNSPHALALDSSGNLYIADTGNHCVRKISGGTITSIAGTGGTIGYSGDGAAATAAKLNAPSGVAFDSSGNLYIADTGNQVIRKITTDGKIATFAGMQGQNSNSGDGGAATSATLNGPTGLAVDSGGNLYIADTGNNVIRRVDTKGIITTFIGATGGNTGTNRKLIAPTGVWFDASGALYIADSGNNRVGKFVVPSAFTNFAGNLTAGAGGDGGPALRAQLNKPTDVTIDAAGNFYVADTNNSKIRKITADGTITTIAGKGGANYGGDGGNATDAVMSFPRGVAVSPNGTVYIADTGNHVIRVLNPTFPSIGAVTNAASYAPRISPGALATIFGTGFGTSIYQVDDGFAWPTTANQVSVKVNGVAAPLYYVSPGQINFQVPWATPTSGTVNVSALVNGGSSNTFAAALGTAAPGMFFDPSNGTAIVQNTPDYSLNSASNPAPAGSTIVAYLTGSGPVKPAAQDGVPTPDGLTNATSVVTAKIGGANATVSFTGLAPTFVGLVQMNIVVPTLTPGVYPLVVTIDGQTSNSATIAVK